MASALLLVVPGGTHAQSEQMATAPPSIGQPLIREGDFSVKLEAALSMGTSQNEVEAENRLAEAGIIPKNGWIADYPVTPDIVDELSTAVRTAAAANKLPLAADVALQRLNDAVAQAGLSVKTPSGGDATISQLPATAEYPSATDISDYYYDAGPPVVTYYAPLPEYYYLYGWVPFPFWCDGFWFPGYFILHDFHRHVHHGDRDRFVSNHFNDERNHRIFRVDPVARLNGTTTAGSRVRPMAGFNREGGTTVITTRGRVFPNNGMVVRPASPAIRRDGAVYNGRGGYGYQGRPVASRAFGTLQRSPAVMAPPMRGGAGMRSGAGSGMSWRGSHSVSLPSRSSGFVGMHYSGGGFAGRGHR